MNDEDKLTQIFQVLSELKVEVSHLSQRLESKSNDIKHLDERMSEVATLKAELNHLLQLNAEQERIMTELQKRISNIEVKLALNDQTTNKFDYWSKIVIGGVITLLLGFIAVKLGLR